jgi:rhodanese-related sulfurtransferase
VTGVVVNLAGDHSNQAALGALTAFGIILAVALPPGLAAWLRRRRGQARG